VWWSLVLVSVVGCRFEPGSVSLDGEPDAADLPACAGPGTGTIALYPFDSDRGTSTLQDATTAHQGTQVGAIAFEPGPPGCGAALRFANQLADYGVIVDDSAWDLTAGSISLWLRVDQLGSTQGVLARDETGQAASGHFLLAIAASGRLVVRFQQLTIGQAGVCSNEPLALGRWHDIAVNLGTPLLELWIDGVLQQGTGTEDIFNGVDCDTAADIALDNDLPWVIGAANSTSTGGTAVTAPLSGAIDHLHISAIRHTL
jgi:hypothetical protein